MMMMMMMIIIIIIIIIIIMTVKKWMECLAGETKLLKENKTQ
jgi:hypothetical protein